MNRREALAALGAMALVPASLRAAPGGLRGDLTIMRSALRLHPGLHRYASPARVEDRLARLEQHFVGAPDLEQRYLILSRFLASIRCGHSWCNFFNQAEPVAASLFDRPTRLPFHFAWIGRRMIVLRDPAGLGLAPGSEIVSVNGVPAGAILSALLPYARADGHNDAARVALLGVGGTEEIETFDVFHGLLYGPPRGGMHQVKVRRPGGGQRDEEVPAIGLAARRAQRHGLKAQPGSPAWDWTVRPDGIALLTMDSWALYDSDWDWRGWLADRLSSLAGAKGLIVDLRSNEGGLDCGDALLARLAEAPIPLPPFERRVRFRRTPAELDPYLDTWDRSFRTLGEAGEPIGGGFLRLREEEGDRAIRPEGPRLALPVAALVGPANSSATFRFAEKARATGLVRLFGQATGGNRRGLNGGAYFFVRLPASGLEFDLPLIGYFPPGSPPDSGVEPDVAIAVTPADIASGRDPAMAAAARWITR